MSEEKSEKCDFESRDYQVELYELGIEQNIILYLPTGSGKTYIAILLIKHFCKTNPVYEKIENGGKRAFFLVNTVPLVEQQRKQIEMQTNYNVGGYSGDMGVDFWKDEAWEEEFNKNQVFVMTCQIYVDLIQKNRIGLENTCILIFDECHHGVVKHPMRQVMMNFKNVPPEKWPRVIGLTATLINKNLKPASICEEIKTLENTYIASIQTSLNEEMVKLYSTNPKESKQVFIPNSKEGFCYEVRNRIIDGFKQFLSGLEIEEPPDCDMSNIPYGSKPLNPSSSATFNKRFKNLLDDIVVNMDDLGVFGGSMAVLAHLVQLCRMRTTVILETSQLVFQSFSTELVLLRSYIEHNMSRSGLSELETIKAYSSDKVRKLFRVLKKIKSSDRVIIFVQRRFTAKTLFYVVNAASKVDPDLKEIKCDYMVGFSCANPFKDTRENLMLRKHNNNILKKFNQGLVNVLIASNVVEEGVDIQKCNYVIMLDTIPDFRSYIQSKGRARDKDSHYIIFVSSNDTKFEGKYGNFQCLESVLKEIFSGGKSRSRAPPTQEELDRALFSETPGLEPFMPRGCNGPYVTCLSAISVCNRYFATLACDKFTKVSPGWFIKTVGKKYQCFVNLPLGSKVEPKVVKGTVQNNKDEAKQSVALEVCKKLYEFGELDAEWLLPLKPKNMVLTDFTPCFDDTEQREQKDANGKKFCLGTKKHKRIVPRKWAEVLCNCMPEPGKEVFVHLIEMKPVYDPQPQDNQRLVYIHQTLSLPTSFVLISAKRLPKLASFPVFLSVGELEVEISQVDTVKFTEPQLKVISDFHKKIFDEVLQTAKCFTLKDLSNGQNAFLIAPATKDTTGSLTIDYEVCTKLNEAKFPSTDKKPSNEVRENLVVTDESYLGKVVSPWYRTIPAQKYIVTKVRYDLNEQSDFPNDNYSSYKEYFQDKYAIETLCSGQPLIEVRPFSEKLKSIKPRSLTKQIKRKSNKELNEDYDVTLVPEYCVLYPLDGKYWLKALLLPSALHRISQLAIAEELRISIAQETKIFPLTLPTGGWEKVTEDLSLRKDGKDEVDQRAQAFVPLPVVKGSSPQTQSPWKDEEEPIDIDRNIDNLTMFDIVAYEDFISKPALGVASGNFEENRRLLTTSPSASPKKTTFVDPPPLHLLGRSASDGPQQTNLMQALITASSLDFVNCERLETLGDAFLKFAVSLILFDTQPDLLSEGHLTTIKGKVVGNKNLYFCGMKRNLGSILQVQDFSPNEEWLPPRFQVPAPVRETILSAGLNPNVILNIKIPEDERASGVLSAKTMNQIGDLLEEAEDRTENCNCPFLNIQAITDKNVSDCVEAVLGVYLKDCGVEGAFTVMNYFNVINPKLSKLKVLSKESVTTAAKGKGDPNQYLDHPHLLENILNYKFRDRSFLLQALTHSTFSRNVVTLNYQRLEFLGDALIDFLITVHIYERCSTLSPGDLTDLRSALVNNITLACLSVRHQFHKFLLYHSNLLHDTISVFVKNQMSKENVVDEDVLFLLEEQDVNISEAIEVPKALGDVFEAIIGAVYLDSGKNLQTTWTVLYNLMKTEIDAFSINIPKNHVRMLYESDCEPVFTKHEQSKDIVMVTVEVVINKELRLFNGFGDNNRVAKRAAAKHALRAYRKAQEAQSL
nr:dicer-2 [Amrasca biguttula biguttula]